MSDEKITRLETEPERNARSVIDEITRALETAKNPDKPPLAVALVIAYPNASHSFVGGLYKNGLTLLGAIETMKSDLLHDLGATGEHESVEPE